MKAPCLVREFVFTATALAIIETAPHASAQDLYDTSVLRTIELTFQDPNWFQTLEQNYASQTEIACDMTVEGVSYPGVGVRIRGNGSYTGLPQGSQKVSLNIDVEFTNPDQALMGYESLNLLNGFKDPTFCREVAYDNFVSRYIPHPRANHVLLTINGENWGVYVNAQQYNKKLLRSTFEDDEGLRVKGPNATNGPGLQYFGNDPALYSAYEIKADGSLSDPIGAVIDVCDAVSNSPLDDLAALDSVLALDPSIWSVVLENLFSDEDSYVHKGSDFRLYRDPVDGRTHLHQNDGNESFSDIEWSATENFDDATKPFLSRVLSVPALRARYMAHLRSALEEFDWQILGPELLAMRSQLRDEVERDPKRIYNMRGFLDGLFEEVTLGYGPPSERNVPGLQKFVEGRRALLLADPEVAARGPLIPWLRASSLAPAPGEALAIRARVRPADDAVAGVRLYYRDEVGSYSSIAMLDDGFASDDLAGDGIYSAQVPTTGLPGQAVEFYVEAEAANTFGSRRYLPERSELGPERIEFTFGSSGLHVTEYMYKGSDGEFVEFTNLSATPLDLNGWSFDDSSATAGTFDLSPAGVLMPGASLIVTEEAAPDFSAAWNLDASVAVLGGNDVATLGRNDALHVFDQNGLLVERLRYGDEDFPGTIRTKDVSGQACRYAFGLDDAELWQLSHSGDSFGSALSAGGDIGSPGAHSSVPCEFPIGENFCEAGINTVGSQAFLSATGSEELANDDVELTVAGARANVLGLFIVGFDSVQLPFGSGFRCAGGGIFRVAAMITDAMDGSATHRLTFDTPWSAALAAGETRSFQFWYRDDDGFNLSDGLRISFR